VAQVTFGRPTLAQRQEQRAREKTANMQALATIPAHKLHRGSYEGTTGGASPKTEAKRNRALLDIARGRRCLLRVPDACTGDTATTVACHSNLSLHGKAGARKADDQYAVWGCLACHRWLDQGPADAGVKQSIFMLAHFDQVLEWRRIAADSTESARFRRAAKWALEQLNATPIGVSK
jgi:hypothetical protein